MPVHNSMHNTPHNYVHNTPYNSDDEKLDNVVTLISKLDLSHPLHLHLNDSTTLTIVFIKLKGIENYNVWSCAMLLAFKGVLVMLLDFKKRGQLMQFLMGLDDSYMQIRSNILSRDPLPDAKRAYALISSEEYHRVVTGSGGANQQLTYTDKNLIYVIDISYLKIIVSHPNGTEALITKYLMDVKTMKIGKQVNGLYYFDNMEGSNGFAREDEMDATSDPNTALSEDDVPNSLNTEHVQNEACKDQQWVEAMNKEIDALYRNNTWEITDLPKDRKSIGGKWVYKIKYKSNGEIEIYKARYVVRGYNQKEGIDFDETFSSVVKIVTVRCLINLAMQNDLTLYQLDINNAFLYGDLVETFYMDFPEGYYSPDDKRSKSDYSLFTKSKNGNSLALLVYVDDIIVTRNNFDEIQKFKDFLRTKFQIKYLGKLKYLLGIKVLETDQGLCLSQRKYCLDFLGEFGLLACKPSATPLEQNLAITNEPTDADKVLDSITEYQKLIGKLIYLTHTRPDISYSVYCLSQFMHKSLRSHLKIALKVLRYLKGNPGKGIHIVKQLKSSFEAFVDANWAKCPAIRKSVTGFCVKLNGSLIS
nr:ribonuclease H-like domain-containing protein [Tanacetum cinerariifolium]